MWAWNRFCSTRSNKWWLRAHRRSTFSVLLRIAVCRRLLSSPRPPWTVKVLFRHFFTHAALFITHRSRTPAEFSVKWEWGPARNQHQRTPQLLSFHGGALWMKAATKGKFKKKDRLIYLRGWSEFRLNTEGASLPERFATLARAHPRPRTPPWPDNWILQAQAALVCNSVHTIYFYAHLTELKHRLLLLTHTHTRLHVCKSSLRNEGEKSITYHFLPSQSRMKSPSLAVKNTLWHTLLTHWLAVGGQASGRERERQRGMREERVRAARKSKSGTASQSGGGSSSTDAAERHLPYDHILWARIPVSLPLSLLPLLYAAFRMG